MRLLLVEDEENIAKPLKKTLESKGFAVDYAHDGREALDSAEINGYDCVLLDLNLPEIDGIEVAKNLRRMEDSTPIIMVTARTQIVQKIEGFDYGADDYVTKPFNTQELIARINAVIKRNSLNKSETLSAGDLELDPGANTVVRTSGGERDKITLTSKETGVLEYLIRNKDSIVSTEELLEHVWDEEIDMFTETVKTHIKTLRKKVDPEKELIKTIRGKGYMITD